MKKAFSLLLAAAMVLSMAAISLATTNSELVDEDTGVPGYIDVAKDSASTWDTDDKVMNAVGDTAAYGKTIYYAVMYAATEGGEADTPANDSKQVSGLKLTPKWTDGASFVKSVEFVKKGGAYYVAVNTTGSSLDENDVSGKIYVKGTSGSGDDKYKVDGYFDIDLTLGYTRVTTDTLVKDTKKVFAWDAKRIFEMDDIDRDEVTVYFVPEDDAATETTKNAVASVVIDATNEEDVLMYYSVDEIAAIADAYPKANLDFVALTGSFKKTAEATVYADEGTYLYKVVDGKLQKMDAEYDEWEEAFVFNTKTLGTYVISDIELDIAASVEENVTVEGGNNAGNPNTGAAL